jgi:hypothetical protein
MDTEERVIDKDQRHRGTFNVKTCQLENKDISPNLTSLSLMIITSTQYLPASASPIASGGPSMILVFLACQKIYDFGYWVSEVWYEGFLSVDL